MRWCWNIEDGSMGERRRKKGGRKVVKSEGLRVRWMEERVIGEAQGTATLFRLTVASGSSGELWKGRGRTNPLEKVSVKGVKTNGDRGGFCIQ
jgi:hypothetical protein